MNNKFDILFNTFRNLSDIKAVLCKFIFAKLLDTRFQINKLISCSDLDLFIYVVDLVSSLHEINIDLDKILSSKILVYLTIANYSMMQILLVNTESNEKHCSRYVKIDDIEHNQIFDDKYVEVGISILINNIAKDDYVQ